MKKKFLLGSLTVFVMILVGFILGFYLMGFKSPAIDFFQKTVSGNSVTSSDFNVVGFLNSIKNAILTPFGLGVTGVVVLFSLATAFTGGGAGTVGVVGFLGWLVPILIIFSVANIFFFPIVSAMGAEGVASLNPVNMILACVLNIFLMLTIVEFISGRN
jgi:hypothetical protein